MLDAAGEQEQREWLRVTLASIGDGVIATDTEARVTFLNPVAESLTAWTQEEACGQPLNAVFTIVNEETRNLAENPVSRVMKEGVVSGLANHTLLIARDGTERPIDDTAAPIRNARGQVAGAVLVFRDITGRRRAERLAQDALTYADNTLATVREPLIVLDKELRVRSANRSFYRVFHVPMEETEGHRIYDLGNGQWNIPRLRELLEDVLPQNHPFEDFEVEHEFPQIGLRTMLLNARRLPPWGGHESLILLAIEDVTERKRAEVRLEESELRYRRLFETARDGILIIDGETGRIMDANPFMAELLGYSRHEFLGKELWEIGLLREKEENQRAFEELQQREYIRYEHLQLETRGGGQVGVEFVSNVYPVDGKRMIQCNIRDITERRLIQRVQQQADELADAGRRKDEFLAMLSHELRNPLATIANSVHLLRLQPDENAIQRETRSVIERQVTHLTRLVDDLLEVSRITTGRIRLRQERVALSGIVENAVEMMRPLVAQCQHDLTVTIPPEPIWLYADAERLVQVVANLLTNSIRYTNQGGTIWVTAEQEGQEAVVRVRDTGVGIVPEFLPYVFDLFAQGEQPLARSQGGLGIGLAVARALVEMHGGKVEAYSAGEGQGSEFIVRLPVTTLPATPEPPTPEASVSSGQSRLRVLLVDDNVDMARIFGRLLERLGHSVRTAFTGTEALEAAQEFRPDVVLLDIGLPDMDGYEAARRMRQEAALQAVVLVALTGYGLEADRARSQEAGFDHHLVKPADMDVLRRILAAVAESRHSS